MKITHRCPKCGCTRLARSHIRFEEAANQAFWLEERIRWYEAYACTACGFEERYALASRPGAPVRDEIVQAPAPPGQGGPHR
jgi:predicted nucleic-acid-binding Zn-ribbon protein